MTTNDEFTTATPTPVINAALEEIGEHIRNGEQFYAGPTFQRMEHQPDCPAVLTDSMKNCYCGSEFKPYEFISLYEVEQRYGGPEEGGWWWMEYTWIAGERIVYPDYPKLEDAEEAKAQFSQRYGANNHIPNSMSHYRTTTVAILEIELMENQTKEAPRYE